MESRIQDSEQRRREANTNNNNGTTLHSFSQTLDQHHLQRQPSFGHQQQVRSPPITPISKSSIKYKECLKNHAASVGGNVFDGCGEFMPSGEEGTIEALKCAACDCHRNFHRKEVDGETQLRSRSLMLNPIQLPPPLPTSIKYSSMHTSPSSAIVAPMNVAFGGVSESSSEDLNNVFQSDVVQPQPPPPPYVLSKKRFRTKFTQEQKDRMLEFAERIGWRFQKQDEEELERFCAEVGVRRQVFKVWMHNNKNVKNKQEQEQQDDNNNTINTNTSTTSINNINNINPI